MTHLVFGTGLIGGFIAGGLIKQGLLTHLLGREKHQTAMRDGLTLSDLEGNESALSAPQFSHTDDKQLYDFIWLTVKCYSVQRSLEQLRKIVQRSTVIICCQNGFGSSQTLREAFPNNIVLNAVIGFNVAERASNHLHRSTDGWLVVESHQQINDVVAKLDSALLPTKSSADILAERWAKLQLNLSNPVNALADVPVKAMTEDAGYRKIIAALMRELLTVTKQMNLSLPKLTPVPANCLPLIMELPNWLYLKLAHKMLAIDPTARQSMWWDLSQGKESEIMYLNQAVVEQAKHYGIECPVNQKVIELIKAVENGEALIGFSAEQLTQRLLS